MEPRIPLVIPSLREPNLTLPTRHGNLTSIKVVFKRDNYWLPV